MINEYDAKLEAGVERFEDVSLKKSLKKIININVSNLFDTVSEFMRKDPKKIVGDMDKLANEMQTAMIINTLLSVTPDFKKPSVQEKINDSIVQILAKHSIYNVMLEAIVSYIKNEVVREKLYKDKEGKTLIPQTYLHFYNALNENKLFDVKISKRFFKFTDLAEAERALASKDVTNMTEDVVSYRSVDFYLQLEKKNINDMDIYKPEDKSVIILYKVLSKTPVDRSEADKLHSNVENYFLDQGLQKYIHESTIAGK